MAGKNKIILLTGAGCSSIVGLKTLKAIVSGTDGVTIPLNERTSGVETVRETWRIILGEKGDDATLEDLIARLKTFSEIADLLKNNSVLMDALKSNMPQIANGNFKRVWEDALSYCFRLMIENYGPHKVQTNSEGFETIVKVISFLSEYNNNNELHVFTTNYDCVINVMASRVPSINFMSHINNERGIFENKWFVINKDLYKKSNYSVYVHRLHGCIAWFNDHKSPYGIHEVYGAGDNLVILDQNKLNQMAIKLISNEKVGTVPAFLLAFQELYQLLEKCQYLLVWGHSFRDLELLRCIINVLDIRNNKPFEIVYIDPYLMPSDVIQNMRNTISGEISIQRHNFVRPSRVDWVIQDGLSSLIKRISDRIH